MRCANCGQENPDRAKFCLECAAPFAPRCGNCGTELPTNARFCFECAHPVDQAVPPPERSPHTYTPKHLADKILQSKSALEGERKQVTVLFADVKGSLELAEQVDPEEWHAILDRFFQILADGIHRFEGTVNQYTGDGIMALFGAPIAHEDHAQRACYAALHLRDTLREYAQKLRRERGLDLSVRMGLNSGEVVVGKIGDDLRMDYTAQGHTVGLAARMERLAEAAKPYLTQSTAALARGYFELEELGEFRLKGVAEPVRACGLVGVGRMRTRFDVARARGLSKFVGRTDEMSLLEAAMERAVAGNGQVVGVVAEAGVGKSRLCFEFAERCRARGILVRHVQGVAHGKAVPLLPILELLRETFGITSRDTDREARQKIAGGIVLVDQELSEALPLLFEFLGLPDPERPAPALSPEARQRRMLELFRRFSLARSRREPAVVVFEDLHWIDPATEAFVEALADAAEGARTLLLVNFRPEYRADWVHRSYYQQLALRPLDPHAVEELLEEWLGEDASLAGLAARIRERTGGNPFFVEEVVQSAIESGALVGARGSYRLVRAVHDIEIPATVQNVLAARIDRLAEREKRLLQTAAVVGREFSEPLLRRVAETPGEELSEALRALVQSEFLHEQALYPEIEYAFKHALTRDVAYGSQLRARRARVHAVVAQALEKVHAQELDEKAALLAHHWEAAGDAVSAARWHSRAGAWIGGRHPAATREHFSRVRELLDGAPESAETLSLALQARAQLLLYQVREPTPAEGLEQLFREGRKIAERSGDERGLALLLNHWGYMRTINGLAGDYLEALEEARTIADRLGDRALRMAVRNSLSFAWIFSGQHRMEAVLELCDEILDVGAGDLHLGYELMGVGLGLAASWHRASIVAAMGELEAARRHYDHAIELMRQHDDVLMSNLAHAWYVYHSYCVDLLGPEAALHHAQRALEYAEQSGSSAAFLMAHWALGVAHELNGHPDEAIREIEHTLALLRGRAWAWCGTPFIFCDLAQAYLAAGDPRARDAIEGAARHRGPGREGAKIDVMIARVLLRTQGAAARSEVEGAIEHGFKLVEQTGTVALEPELRAERAELARLLGDRSAWKRELREAHRLLVQMGAPRRAAQLAQELES